MVGHSSTKLHGVTSQYTATFSYRHDTNTLCNYQCTIPESLRKAAVKTSQENPCRWQQKVPPKCWYLSTKPHGVTSQGFNVNIHCRQETAYCGPHKRVNPADVMLECRYYSVVSPDRYIMLYATQFHIFFHSYQPHSVLLISSAATSLENSHKTSRKDAMTRAFKTASLDVQKHT